ncbi:MAG: peptidylprolyl isomerase [Bacteroidales bacterium]|nr:peptidylprolyl isomerase [Bacteroidales bacterium]
MKKNILSILVVLAVVFTVKAQTVTVVFPNGGEHFTQEVAAPHNIMWTSTGITNFKVEYSTDNGSSWTTIAADTITNYLDWAPPATITDLCLIKVSDVTETYSDESDAVFSIVESHNYYAEWSTSIGNFRAMLHNDIIPIATQNFINLAERNFYQDLIFHRVIEGFMIQDGCPLGNGMGDPGYEFDDEISPLLTHSFPGVLAMANAGPNTNGSQYYITVDETSWLDGGYTIFGRIVDGMDVVYAISEVATDGSDKPLVDVDIYSVTISDYLPNLAINYPIGGESFIEGDTVVIQWSSDYVADLKIEFSIDNGSSWESIIDSIPADFSEFMWIVPADFSAECLIRVEDIQHASIISMLVVPFEIRVKPVNVTRIELYEGVTPNPENPENIVMPSKPLRFKVKLKNDFDQNLTGLSASLSSTVANVNIDEVTVSSLNQSDEVWTDDYFEIVLPDVMPTISEIPIVISVSADNVADEIWYSAFKIPVLSLGVFPQLDDNNIPDSDGNGNGIIEPDETVEVVIKIANKSTDTCYHVIGQLCSTTTFINVWNNQQGADRIVYDTVAYNNFNPIIPGTSNNEPANDYVFDYTANQIVYVPLLLKAFGFVNGEEGPDFETGGVKMIWGIPHNLNTTYPLINQVVVNQNTFFNIVENPTNGNVRFSYFSEENTSNFDVEIYDVNGRFILSENYNYVLNSTYKLDCTQLDKGIYIMSVKTKDGNLSQKLVIE